MARSRKTIAGAIGFIIITILTVGYFATTSLRGGAAEGPDSTADSTGVAKGDSASGDEKSDKKDKKDDKDKKKEPDPVPVEVATVKPRQISSYYYTTATLEPEKRVKILAKIAGEVTELFVEEGAVVPKGALLCQVEDSELKIALDEARINRDQQKREFDRIKTMHEKKVISDTEFADRQYQYQLAENKFSAAALKYEYTKVRAPFDGIITKRLVEHGQSLSISTELFELVDPTPLLIRMYMPENEIRDIRIGQAVTIEPDNNPDVTLEGMIVRIAPEVDERTGTVKVTAETRGKAMPGSFARIKIVTDTRRGSLTIPRRGLVSDAGELYVYVAEADTVRKAAVHIGYQDEDYAEVLDGVDDGENVVVVGIGGLRTGTKIKILDPNMQDTLSREEDKMEVRPASN